MQMVDSFCKMQLMPGNNYCIIFAHSNRSMKVVGLNRPTIYIILYYSTCEVSLCTVPTVGCAPANRAETR